MRIHIWNAFASNNSGSYTIVGSFPSSETAADVAAELAALMQAHDLWLQSFENSTAFDEPSPLSKFADLHGLAGNENVGTSDDWPQHNSDNVPQVFAINHQVVIHHDYTVTLPVMFGHYFYARGGRVQHELDHAHHPIVGIFELYLPWQERKDVDVNAKVALIVDALTASEGPLMKEIVPGKYPPAWQIKDGFGEPHLTVGAIFADLLAGFKAVDEIAKAAGLKTMVKIFEAPSDDVDPLAYMRPLPGSPDK